MSCGSAAFFRNGYRANLISQWLPALDGVVTRPRAGIAVANIGWGHRHRFTHFRRATETPFNVIFEVRR